jgi:hypothetical protein
VADWSGDLPQAESSAREIVLAVTSLKTRLVALFIMVPVIS